MPIKSMTGFGSSRGSAQGWALRVEIKGVNHKALEARVSAPRDWSAFEAAVLGRLKERVARGRLSVSLDVSREGEAGEAAALLSIDESRFAEVVTQLRGLARRHGLEEALRFEDLSPYRDAFSISQSRAEVEDFSEFEAIFDRALDAFEQTREQEGGTILEMFREHLSALELLREQLITLRPVLLEGYRDRLEQRLKELAAAHGLTLEPERIIQEVIHFGDRTDIAEELQRSGAHLERVRALIEAPDGPHGKKLDFYLQELIRETNTMASKSNFSALTEVVVEMKTRIEQLREQAANVE